MPRKDYKSRLQYNREYDRRKRRENPEKVNSVQRAKYTRNAERVRVYMREYQWKKNGWPRPTRKMPKNCECCGAPPSAKVLNLDHCHTTNVFRGWLCWNCNTSIGKLGDTIAGLQQAINYLKRASAT